MGVISGNNYQQTMLSRIIINNWTKPGNKVSKMLDKETDEGTRSWYKIKLNVGSKADTKFQKITSLGSGQM